jgi:putative hydroxymethylpyrimidine transport system substrate-binding protein
MRRALTLTAALACAALLSACGVIRNQIAPDPAHATPISVELAGAPSADQVGLLAAQADGKFAQADVAAHISAPTSVTAPLSDVEHSRVDVAVTTEPQLMLARSRGATVFAFAALTQRPSDALISLRSRHIGSVRALRGRTVGTDGLLGETRLLDAILTRAHVPLSSVHMVDVGSNLASAISSGRVAATFGDGDDTALSLRRAHRRITVLPVSRLGVPTYDQLVLVCNEVFFANHDNLMRRFVQAVGRGWSVVRADPAAGVHALLAADPSLNATVQTAAVKRTVAGVFPSHGEPWGFQQQHEWNTFGRWMTAQHLIIGEAAWYEASTNQLLAGVGP